MGAVYNVWAVCIMCESYSVGLCILCGSVAYCVGVWYHVWELQCGSFVYCVGALYNVWGFCIIRGSYIVGLCIICGSFV